MLGDRRVIRVADNTAVRAMTERSAAKIKRSEDPKPARKAAGAAASAAEIARLEAELAAALRRIEELEKCHQDVVNRIEWVIDSLHNLPHGK